MNGQGCRPPMQKIVYTADLLGTFLAKTGESGVLASLA
jgi:hypothetical protein